MRCLMLGLGAAGTFVEDWAIAASRSADVVGITKFRSLPPGGRHVAPTMSLGAVAGFPVVFTETPTRIRPKRLARRINNWLEVSRLMPAVRFLEREFGPIDIVHSHFYAGSGAVPGLAARLGVPFVHTEHSSRLVADPSLPRSSRRAMGELFGHAAAVIFVSADQVDFVHELGIEGPFQVMPNPVDDRLFSFGRGGFPKEVRLITVGNLLPVKRHALLLHAVAEARLHDPRIRLDIVGSGICLPALENQCSRLGLTDVVHFWGRIDRAEVAARLAQSDIYVHVSATETFGVAIVEALLSGLPVVVAKAGGVTRSIPTSMGITVERPEPTTFSAAILNAIGWLPVLSKETIATEGRRLFAADAVADRLHRVYLEALKR